MRYRGSGPGSGYKSAGNSVAALQAAFGAVPEAANDAVAIAPQPAPVAIAALSLMQRAALIQMTENQVKRAIVARLLEDSQDRPDTQDYHDLVAMGLAEKNPADRWHKLTAEGRMLARELQHRLCAELGIHLMQEGSWNAGWQVRFFCCCGQWSQSFQKGHHTRSQACRSFHAHCERTVEPRRREIVETA